jgi:glycine betaine catabolism A
VATREDPVEAAPIDRALLEACVAPFPEQARTLPAVAYTSPAVFDWERKHLFEAGWFCLGRTEELRVPGDQKAVWVGNSGILLVSGEDGRIRGFHNTCRHRGHELLPTDGSATNDRMVRCPYHRWMYDLDGRFRGGPGLAAQPGFDKEEPGHSLVPARVERWRGWAFANVTGEASDLAEYIGPLDDLIAPYEAERLSRAAGHRYELTANWKVIAENYHECYHCTEIHPELCRVSTPGSGRQYERSPVIVGGSMELLPHAETMSMDGVSRGRRFRRMSSSVREVHYLQLFPNLLLSIHPDYVMTHRLEPIAHDRTVVECEWLFPPEAMDLVDFDPSYAVDFWDLTNRQDWAACESVQRGVAGPGHRQAPFSEMERCVARAMGLVARAYMDGGVRQLLGAADWPIGPA